MEFRAVTQQESLELMELQAQAFFFTYDRKKYKEEIDANGTWRTGRGAFDDNGKLVACLSLLSFEAHFDGSIVGLGGIGGVASRPEDRNSGNVRGLMASVLNEMADNGDVFSFLYPFSNEYYRKFGYESCHRAAHITAPLELFKTMRQPGHAEHFLPGQDGTDPTPIIDIYNDFAARHNLCVDREGWRWRDLLERDPVSSRRHVYVWCGEDGVPGAYVIFKAGPDNDVNRMEVKEMAWRTHGALCGLLGFLSGFGSNLKTMLWDIPTSLDPEILFPESKDIQIELAGGGMNRVVNAQKALKLMKKPDGKGNVRVSVVDEFMPRNTGVYKIDWEDGQSSTRKVKGASADLECSAQALAQLCVGYLPLRQMLLKRDVAVNGKADELEKLFIQKDILIMDHF